MSDNITIDYHADDEPEPGQLCSLCMKPIKTPWWHIYLTLIEIVADDGCWEQLEELIQQARIIKVIGGVIEGTTPIH